MLNLSFIGFKLQHSHTLLTVLKFNTNLRSYSLDSLEVQVLTNSQMHRFQSSPELHHCTFPILFLLPCNGIQIKLLNMAVPNLAVCQRICFHIVIHLPLFWFTEVKYPLQKCYQIHNPLFLCDGLSRNIYRDIYTDIYTL